MSRTPANRSAQGRRTGNLTGTVRLGVIRVDIAECACSAAHARRCFRRKNSGFWRAQFCNEVARSERFELPTLGIEIRCSIQLSYERVTGRLPEPAKACQQ